MLNQEPEFFYSRNLKIGNSIDNTIVSNIEYQQEDESHYTAKVRFTSNTQEAFGNTAIRYRYIENGKIKDKGKRKTDENVVLFFIRYVFDSTSMICASRSKVLSFLLPIC